MPKPKAPAKKPATKPVSKNAAPTGQTVPHTHLHADGTLWAKGFLRDGVMVGAWEWYRKDGSKMRAGSFDDKGKQIGEWTTFASDGLIVKVTKMK